MDSPHGGRGPTRARTGRSHSPPDGESPLARILFGSLAVETDVKGKLIAEYKRADKDTGSPEVQVALSTTRIRGPTGHRKPNTKNHTSRPPRAPPPGGQATASAELPEGHRHRALSRARRQARDQEIARPGCSRSI